MTRFQVDLPAGGQLELAGPDEVQMWTDSARRYIEDYGLVKANDLMLLGAILSQGVAMYRAQRDLNDPKKAASAQKTISTASEQIRELEKALGIDKKSREAGGQHTVGAYVTTLKRAAHEKGVHIAARVKAYEAFAMEMRWKLRLLENGDAEDLQYHGLSETALCEWARQELGRLEEIDVKYAHEKHRVFIGRL
jgi:hypothetical protein